MATPLPTTLGDTLAQLQLTLVGAVWGANVVDGGRRNGLCVGSRRIDGCLLDIDGATRNREVVRWQRGQRS